ncbi:MAG: trypsin-like peptidase domain-containing protein, partial [Erysipelotrichaceae bacterium]|nr:trypsin-like peptidase domain-containing protein [Erysipelotrichaceae bacterium]
MNSQKMPTPPAPKKSGSRGSHNAKVIGICTVITLCGVGAAGFAGYAGGRLASGSNTASSTTHIGKENSTPVTTSVEVKDVSSVVEKVSPSVVEITTEVVSNGNSMFGQYVASGAGSGVILSEDGYIVTNNHVIENASNIQVKTPDGQSYTAKLVGTDPQTDIAVIKVDAAGLTPAAIGNSDNIQVGQAAIAIGNPLGSLGGTVTTGIISAVGREITVEGETMTLLQTDAAINSGNSGGGLFDASGNLIGIVNAKQAATGIEGLGFAIPISDVTQVISDLVDHGTVTSRPLLNVTLQDVPEGYSTRLEPGVYIYQVNEGGAAAQAGLKTGDK